MKKKKQVRSLPTPTEEQFTALNNAYRFFNQQLFNNEFLVVSLTFPE
jgi:hypothetical protein